MRKLFSIALALVMIFSSIAIIGVSAEDSETYTWSDNLVPTEYSNFDSFSVGTDPIASSNNLMIYGGATNVNVVYDEQKGSNVLNWTGSANYHSPRWNIGGLLKDIANDRGLKELTVKVSVDVKMNSTAAPDATNTVGNIGDFVLNGANGVNGIMLQENFGNQMGTWFTVSGEFTLNEADIQSINMADNAKNYGITFKGWVTGVPYGHFDNMKVQVLVPTGYDWSDNIIPSNYSDFDNLQVGTDPIATSNNFMLYGSTTNVNVVYDAQKESNVLNFTGSANYHSPRWNIGGLLKNIAEEKGLTELRVKVSVDIKMNSTAAPGATNTVGNIGDFVLNGANGVTGIMLQENFGNQMGTWFTVSGEFTLTEADIRSIDMTDNKKNYGITFQGWVTGAPYGHIDNVSVKVFVPVELKPTPVPTEEPTTTPEPTPFNGLVNGNAENGIENWGVMYGNNGLVEQVADGANGTGNSIKFTPGERFSWGQMGSVAYDLTPQIIAEGAGTYKLSFYIKAEDKKEGQFSLGVGSMYWQIGTGAKYDPNDATKLTTVPTAYNITQVIISDEWQKVNVKFEITEEYLAQIALVHAVRPDQAKLFFRLDGSQGAFKNAGNEFSYFVDEVTIKYMDGVITGANLEVGSTLTVNYYAKLTEEYTSAQMVFTRNNKTVTVEGVLDNGMYKFAYTGINPQCMNDNISAQLVLGDEVLDVMENYSVKKYCDNQAGKTFEEIGISEEKHIALKTFMANMLIYGAEAQKYMDYNEDNLVTENSAWIDEAKISYEIPTADINIEGNKDANNKAYAVTLNLSNVIQVVFKLNSTDDVEVYINDEKAVIVDNTVRSEAIKADDFDKAQILIIKKDGEVISKVEYAVNDYIANKYNSESIGKIVCALNNYGVSAVNYRDAQ